MGEIVMLAKSVDELKKGMVLAHTVYNDQSMKIIARDTVLDDSTIDRLGKSGISQVWIVGYNEATAAKQIPRHLYDDIVEALNGIRIKVLTEAVFDYQIVARLADRIIKHTSVNFLPFTEFVRLKQNTPTVSEHLAAVSFITGSLAVARRFEHFEKKDMIIAALCHDIGKFFIPDSLLKKKDLTEEEQFYIMKHVTMGHDLLAGIQGFKSSVLTMVVQHHERLDGSGYPYGFSGDAVNRMALLNGLADTYASLGREQMSGFYMPSYEVAEFILAQAGIKFPKEDVELLMSEIVAYPLQSIVRLNTGEQARVVHKNKQAPTRPVVKIGRQIVDLSKTLTVFVEEVLELFSNDPNKIIT
jgi:HD-GYP domain-containing protein (c-di-GMP phosphodiesterase class II)